MSSTHRFAELGTRDAESPWFHLTSAKGMPARMATALRGYAHAEAFALMLYACQRCLHREVIWNSRDGVTPFCTACPTCGSPTLQHTQFAHDWCAPDHRPHAGQRVWVDMTKDRARQLVNALMTHPQYRDQQWSKEQQEALVNSYYHDGTGPDLAICGYGWSPKT